MGDDKADRLDSTYSFGETNRAVERLRVVSDVFNPTTEAFVSEAVRKRPRLALDLGCGPGFITRLLSRITRAERIVGIDRSEAFLCASRAACGPGEDYVVADVMAIPFKNREAAARRPT